MLKRVLVLDLQSIGRYSRLFLQCLPRSLLVLQGSPCHRLLLRQQRIQLNKEIIADHISGPFPYPPLCTLLQNGQTTAEIQEEVALTNLGSSSAISKRHSASDKMHFPCSNLQTITTLGKGEFGEVFLAKAKGIEDNETEVLVLVKSLQTRDEQLQLDFRQEFEMFGKLNHSNVVRLLGLCREAEPHFMVLEYVDLGDLKQFLRISRTKDEKLKPQPISTKQKFSFCFQVALGMEHLSNSRFVHKDLAARNCLVSAQRQVKISSLSLSKDVYSSEYYHYHQARIPLRWMPPEAVLEDEFSTKSDVWSFGVFMWEIFTLENPPLENLRLSPLGIVPKKQGRLGLLNASI
ncbi:inactive tyrosine-protein kinase 7-like [Rhineura floridana]|uniref:inactive tyrosine-protein kinase 7-like n=1 Tax=Rhineura floridana TaxID=261503 RepID=UPI002AC81AE5|nr:inactive tyrosine-protein kinase 7-like [Rhineura floridana]